MRHPKERKTGFLWRKRDTTTPGKPQALRRWRGGAPGPDVALQLTRRRGRPAPKACRAPGGGKGAEGRERRRRAAGRGADASTAAGKPREAAVVPPDAGRRSEGVPGPQGPRGAAGPEPHAPRPALSSPEASGLPEGPTESHSPAAGLPGCRAAGLQAPPLTVPPALARRRRPRRA